MLFAGQPCTRTVRLQRLCTASSLMRVQLLIIRFIVLLGCSSSAAADYKDDIGYARLLDELGVSNIPNGSGVPVTQAEYTTHTATLTTLAGDAVVNGLTMATQSSWNNQMAVQVAAKTKIIGHFIIKRTSDASDYAGVGLRAVKKRCVTSGQLTL